MTVVLTDLWPRVEPLLSRVERPSRYIDSEWGARTPELGEHRTVLIYPDAYEIGQSNQGLAILYGLLNDAPGHAAERAYVPWIDMAREMRAAGVPLFSLETCAPVREFDLVGITLPYELTYTNILEALDLAGMPLHAAERGEADPLVIGGGPCAYNPEPLATFFDAILIGEGEEAILEIARAHRDARRAGRTRAEILEELTRIDGVYVPRLYRDDEAVGLAPQSGAPRVVVKRVPPALAEHPSPSCPVVPFMDVVHDRLAIEVLRGCTRGCRFCQAGSVYRPVRERRADDIVRDVIDGLACTGYEEVSLTSLSTADHTELEEVLRRLTSRLEGTGVNISLPSLRVESFTLPLARLAAAGRASGLTFAPEAGTQRLRDVINKNVTEDGLLETVRRAFGAGWRRVKLYFMIGLPTETDADVAAIGALVAKVRETAKDATGASERGSVRVGVSVSTFVPKAHTPFQWCGQLSLEETVRRQGILRDAMPRKGIDLSWHDARVSFVEGVMARGGREVSAAIEHAWRSGSVFDAWTERFDLNAWRDAFAAASVDAEAIATRTFRLDETLPWSHISCGVSEESLRREREKSLRAATTSDCRDAGCTGCGVCGTFGLEHPREWSNRAGG
ncbi:MAG TPA: TIGR03960 family B12-binding radical SAM protein [Coriobacteriia bacterium]|nr:TIGR03960 family B12-binding radical SAM protein [Coriobacteriia bacterium]